MTVVRRFRVHGRVQGVGFRAFVQREATMLNVGGWVRNRSDGTVEALVWGDAEVVETLGKRIKQGPRWGRVDRLAANDELEHGDAPSGFVIRSDHG